MGRAVSATGRNLPGSERRADDFYSTPSWCVQALLRGVDLSGFGSKWLEPSAGSGMIVKAVSDALPYWSPHWMLSELREEELRCDGALLRFLLACDLTDEFVEDVQVGDFLTLPRFDEIIGQPKPFDVCIGNPPYSLAQEFVDRALGCSRVVAFLLRLNFPGSRKRAAWLRRSTPSVYVLPRRPSFTDDNKTDACEYAWFLWGLDAAPRVAVLDPKDCE